MPFRFCLRTFRTILLLSLLAASMNVHGKANRNKIKSLNKKQIEDLVTDSNLTHQRGDLLDSYRKLLLVKDSYPQSFFKADVYSLYLNLVNKIHGSDALNTECRNDLKTANKKLVDSLAYQCSRALYTEGSSLSAESILNDYLSKSNDVRVKILAASVQLSLANPEKCNQEISKSQPRGDWGDLIRITKARCYSEMGKYDLAITELQSLPSKSDKYMEALIDLAWVHFKARNIGDTKYSIEVILNLYGTSKASQGVSEKDYFSIRFLKAYLGLVQIGSSDVVQEMNRVQEDIFSALQRSEYSKKDFSDLIAELEKPGANWLVINSTDSKWGSLFRLIDVWGTGAESSRWKNELELYYSLSKESNRSTIRSNKNYIKDVNSLLKKWKPKLVENLQENYLDSKRLLNSYKLRINLAKHQIKTLELSSGVKTLEQAKEIYRQKEHYVEDLVGGIQ